jgi:hypothetical protein
MGSPVVGKAGGTILTREELEAPTVEIPVVTQSVMMRQDEERSSLEKARMAEEDTGEIPVILSSESESSKKSGSTGDGSSMGDLQGAHDVVTYAAPVYAVPSRPSNRYDMGNVGRDELELHRSSRR